MRRQVTHSSKPGTIALLVLLFIPLVGCEDDPTAPADEPGILEAVVRDASPASSVMLSMAPALSSQDNGGEFRAELRVQVEMDGSWHDVDDLIGLTTQVAIGGGEDTMGIAAVEARTYDRMRVVLSDATANVGAGAEIGLGPIERAASVAIANGSQLAIERNAPVTIRANATTRVILNLNSEAWLTADALETGVVSRSAFESGATLTIQ